MKRFTQFVLVANHCNEAGYLMYGYHQVPCPDCNDY